MAIVTVKNKFQVVIPQHVREQIGVSVGDVFEATARNGTIVFEPKSIVDRGIAQSLAEFKAGPSFGRYDTHEQFLEALHKEAKKTTTRKTKRRVR